MDRILIVDDEFLIRYTLEEGLKDRGYDAYSAATVEEGLEFVRKYHPGVLLLDNLLENSVGMDEIVNFKNEDNCYFGCQSGKRNGKCVCTWCSILYFKAV